MWVVFHQSVCLPYFPRYQSIREISRPKFLGLKTRILSYTHHISQPSSKLTVFQDVSYYWEWDPFDAVLTGLTDVETLELFKSDDEEDEFDRF